MKSDRINRYLTSAPIYVYDNVSLNSSYDEKYFRQNCRENQNIHFIFNIFFFDSRAVYELTWKNNVEPDRPQMAI
jgi:hypothetical protein